MKKNMNLLLAVGMTTMVTMGASFAMAEEEKPTADLTVATYSQYVWRGFELSQDSLIIQPSMTVGYKGFSFNLWSNLDTDYFGVSEGRTDTGGSSFNETDLTLSYDGNYDKLGYGVGYIYYALDDGLMDEQEAYISLSYDILLSPSLTIYRNFSHTLGWYAVAGISHSFPVTETLSLDLGASASYISFDDEGDYADPNDASDAYSDFHDAVLSASMTIPVNDYISVTPELYYSLPLSSDAETILENANAKGSEVTGDDSIIYGGLSVSFAF